MKYQWFIRGLIVAPVATINRAAEQRYRRAAPLQHYERDAQADEEQGQRDRQGDRCAILVVVGHLIRGEDRVAWTEVDDVRSDDHRRGAEGAHDEAGDVLMRTEHRPRWLRELEHADETGAAGRASRRPSTTRDEFACAPGAGTARAITAAIAAAPRVPATSTRSASE
jgi:hypothetical protein